MLIVAMVVLVTITLMVVAMPKNRKLFEQEKSQETKPKRPAELFGIFATCNCLRQ